MGLAQKELEVGQGAVVRVNAPVVGNVVAVVAKRRGIKGQKPQRPDAQALKIVQVLYKPLEVADAVTVAVSERTHVQFVKDGSFVPQGIDSQHCTASIIQRSAKMERIFPNSSIDRI